AGVAVTAVRYNGLIHDFVLLNGIRNDPGTLAALEQVSDTIRDALKPASGSATRAASRWSHLGGSSDARCCCPPFSEDLRAWTPVSRAYVTPQSESATSSRSQRIMRWVR